MTIKPEVVQLTTAAGFDEHDLKPPMTIQLLVAQLSAALESDPSTRDSLWAYGRCAESRDIHEDIWESRADRKYVARIVIPLLKRTHVAMLKANKTGKYADKVDRFARNIDSRIVNIENNYLKGKPSAFVPADKLEQLEAEELQTERTSASTNGCR